jgi:hypothetical protein
MLVYKAQVAHKDRKVLKEYKDRREFRVHRAYKDRKDYKEIREVKDYKEIKEVKDLKEYKDHRDQVDQEDLKDRKDLLVIMETTAVMEIKDLKDRKDLLVIMETTAVMEIKALRVQLVPVARMVAVQVLGILLFGQMEFNFMYNGFMVDRAQLVGLLRSPMCLPQVLVLLTAPVQTVLQIKLPRIQEPVPL